MTDNDPSRPGDPSRPWPGAPREWWDDVRLAAGFLTRFSFKAQGEGEGEGEGEGVARPLAQAVRVFPVIGAGLGLGAGLVYGLASALGLPPVLAAAAAVACLVLATGALHEDGLADTADGLGGGATVERKLAIMRDSAIGSYGVIAIVLSLMVRVAALGELADPVLVLAALVVAGAASRAALPAVMLWLPLARGDGAAARAGKPGQRDVIIAGVAALVIAAIALDFAVALACLLMGALAALAMAALARRLIGGYTGDILGAVQQAAEIAILMTLAAL